MKLTRCLDRFVVYKDEMAISTPFWSGATCLVAGFLVAGVEAAALAHRRGPREILWGKIGTAVKL
jgi:hypothetical protein